MSLTSPNLYKTGCKGEMVDKKLVEGVQEQAQLMLAQYMWHGKHQGILSPSMTPPRDIARFGKALLFLPTLRSIPANAMHNLFFSSSRDISGSIMSQSKVHFQLSTDIQ